MTRGLEDSSVASASLHLAVKTVGDWVPSSCLRTAACVSSDVVSLWWMNSLLVAGEQSLASS